MNSKVYIVDDNRDFCDSLKYLFDSVNIPSEVFHNPLDFLKNTPKDPGCLLLDLRMSGMTGLAVQDILNKDGVRIPLIFMTAHGDASIAVRAMKKGAFDFLTKPFDHQRLLETIHKAFILDERRRNERKKYEVFLRLTNQERIIVDKIILGDSTTDIAAFLHLSPKTIEYHRAKIMRKLGVGSLIELTQLYCCYRQYIALDLE